jgi:hypothetical protein
LTDRHFKRDLRIAAALVVAHWLLKRWLADGSVVAALLSPAGLESGLALGGAAAFVVVRVAVVVILPGWLAATLARAIVDRIGARRAELRG